MKQLLVLLIAGLIIAGLALGAYAQGTGPKPSPAPEAPKTIDALYQAAKKEGKVTYWGPADPPQVALLAKAFNQKYPGIEVEHFEITSTEGEARTLAEAQAGRYSWDLHEPHMSAAIDLHKRGLLATYDWNKVFGIPKDGISLGGAFLSGYHIGYVLVYNTSMLTREQVPKTWDKVLTDTRFDNGKMVAMSRALGYGYLATTWGAKKVLDFARRVKAKKPRLEASGTTILALVASGEYAIGLDTFLHKTQQFIVEKKAPIDWIALDNTIGAGQKGLILLAKGPHPNAGKLFAGFSSTAEGKALKEKIAFEANLLSGTKQAAIVAKEGIKLSIETPENTEEVLKVQREAAKILAGMAK